MTQEATPASVQGRFDGQRLEAFGGVVRPIREGEGYAFEYLDPNTGAVQGRVPVLRTVGSHRYQQYLTRAADGETYYRLHYLWHNDEQRWVHMNAAFLGSDAQDFDAQVTVWNANCVFCHNTAVTPRIRNLEELRTRAARGEPVNWIHDLRFDTEVTELGISCESCHGPGADHVARMQSLPARVWARYGGLEDPSIVNPQELDADRSRAICGACHAGRKPPDVATLDRWLVDGLDFRPGDDLEAHFHVLHRDSPSPSPAQPDIFRNRFWADGSVRLTAYEYQAMQASACAQESELTCIRCHTMHGGDPAGMLPEQNRGDAPCLRCHQELRTEIAAHSGHPVESSGARCVNCHMPKQVYGVMTIHRSHDIKVPAPQQDLAVGKPNACLNCHAEQNAEWAEQALDQWYPARQRSAAAPRADGVDARWADGLSALLAGDPVRQAVAAYTLGQVDHAVDGHALRVRVPWLLEALRDDRPGVRRFAWRSLRTIDTRLADQGQPLNLFGPLSDYDYTGAPARREAAVQAALAGFAAVDKRGWPIPAAATGLDADYRLDASLRDELLTLGARSDKQIDIGE